MNRQMETRVKNGYAHAYVVGFDSEVLTVSARLVRVPDLREGSGDLRPTSEDADVDQQDLGYQIKE